ncbi:MAG TPA: Spo0B domain-containing protein [Virgibacillus sp.]|nr:Spo0B domain-containing protein [Virgibacillus sp.]
MEEKDVVGLLQNQRHDMLNHLQIIQGYLSMGNTEKVKDKMETWLDYFNEERKLFNLNAPLFALWIMQFNHMYTNARLTYKVHIKKKNLQTVDQQLTEQCKQMINSLMQEQSNSELYEGNLELNESTDDPEIINIKFSINGRFPDAENFKSKFKNKDQYFPVTIQETENGITCYFSISCN